MKKRILSTLLALLMIVTLLPLGLVEPAEAAETLDCTVGVAAGKINPAYTGYVNRAMRYYIRNVSALSNVPDGQSILFFFEGVSAVASPDYKADDYTKSAVRNAAVCLAVKFVNGTPEIYYCEDQCSTFPDMPLEFSYKANGYSPSTIYDGIYKVRLDNHLSGSKEDYAALTLDMSNNYLTGQKRMPFICATMTSAEQANLLRTARLQAEIDLIRFMDTQERRPHRQIHFVGLSGAFSQEQHTGSFLHSWRG